jgi:DNA-binding NtrC family response regulator
MALLSRHDWPGNVRELRNVLERAAVLSSGECIGAKDLQLGSASSTASSVPGAAHSLPADSDLSFAEAKRQTVEGFEREYLSEALRAHEGNVSRTAAAIGMVRQSLQQKIRELGLKADEFRRGKDDA